jgi:membrane dipeptidase
MALPVFDGHNDVLIRDHSFADASEEGHLDLARARAGGFAGGFFAIFTPHPGGYAPDGEPEPPVEHDLAITHTFATIRKLLALERAGAVRVARSPGDLELGEDVLAVMHIEGAEAIDPGLAALDAWHAAGVRSLGLVWSRPSAFGHGVPFRFPASPDTGPGLTDAGRALVRRCAELRIVVDLSHLNAAGFADVVAIGAAPIVVSHAACHALCPSTRNLTDDQLRAVGRSAGLVGIVFAPAFLRADGADDAGTLVAHVRHAVEVAGIDHVGLGSDFDGAPMPAALSDVAGLPRLLDALRHDGFAADEVERIAWGNWRRVLEAAWAPG